MFHWKLTFASGRVKHVWGGYLDQIVSDPEHTYPGEVIVKAERYTSEPKETRPGCMGKCHEAS